MPRGYARDTGGPCGNAPDTVPPCVPGVTLGQKRLQNKRFRAEPCSVVPIVPEPLNQRVEGSSPSGGTFEIRRTFSQSVAFPRTIEDLLSVGLSKAISQTVALRRNRGYRAVLKMLGQMLCFLVGVRGGLFDSALG